MTGRRRAYLSASRLGRSRGRRRKKRGPRSRSCLEAAPEPLLLATCIRPFLFLCPLQNSNVSPPPSSSRPSSTRLRSPPRFRRFTRPQGWPGRKPCRSPARRRPDLEAVSGGDERRNRGPGPARNTSPAPRALLSRFPVAASRARVGNVAVRRGPRRIQSVQREGRRGSPSLRRARPPRSPPGSRSPARRRRRRC
jgi:hypothetical protein